MQGGQAQGMTELAMWGPRGVWRARYAGHEVDQQNLEPGLRMQITLHPVVIVYTAALTMLSPLPTCIVGGPNAFCRAFWWQVILLCLSVHVVPPRAPI